MAVLQTGDNLKKLTSDERLGQNRDSEYLGAEDIDPGAEPILTIDGIWNGLVKLQRGKENKDVMTFSERSVAGIKNVRPLIVNVTNRKTLKKIFGGVQAKTLIGKQIQLYVDHKVRDPEDGGMTDGVRIRPFKPKITAIKCDRCEKQIVAANNMTAEQVAAYTNKKYGASLCAKCAVEAKSMQNEVEK